MTDPPRRRRPDLVLCRTGPDGSDWLLEALSRHPEVAVIPPEAEAATSPLPAPFPATSPFATASRSGDRTDAFEALAASASSAACVTAWYARHASIQPQLPFVIRESLPDARLIFCLRDPTELVFDLWRTAPPEAGLDVDFGRAVAACHHAMRTTSRFDRRNTWMQHLRELPLRETLLEHGMYGPILERFVRLLGRDRLLILSTERLREDPRAALDAVQAFLGLPNPWPADGTLPKVRPPAIEGPSASERALLRPWFLDSNERVRSLVGWSPEATP